MLMESPLWERHEASVLRQMYKIDEAAGLFVCCVWTEFDQN